MGQQTSFSANQQSASQTSSSNASSGKLVSQIVAALRPSITMSVAEALEASRVANAQNAFNSQSSATFTSQASNSGSSSQASNFNAGGASSGSLSSASLSGIFGDGSIHNVRVETPEYKIEYNN